MLLLEQHKQNVMQRLQNCDPAQLKSSLDILVQSDFLVEMFSRYPHWFTDILANPPLSDEHLSYPAKLALLIDDAANDEKQLMKVLRLFRHHMLVRINWAQITNQVDTKHILLQLSALAENLIIAGRDWLYRLSCQEWGTPCNTHGQAQPLIVIGMGKLGGAELNFSSDVDLIFTYPEHGVTQGGRRELDNAVFFTRLGQRLIKVLAQNTEDGFVYRVDMRLRPLGDGGPLVLSFSSMEDYYQEQGRDWERYAMVKARVLGQDGDYPPQFYQMLKPFIYRRYIDFSVLQSLRNMKGMIEREVRRRQLYNNIKLGAGGIREIEFIVQVFQLIRGGRVPCLQTRSLLQALQTIGQEALLTAEEVQVLHDNYLFLRRCENLLQGINDEQTQTLPAEKLDQQRICQVMGFLNWFDFENALLQRTQQNRNIFNGLIGQDDESEHTVDDLANFETLWAIDVELDDIDNVLPQLSDDDRATLLQLIHQFRQDLTKRTIGVRGRDILDQLMPRVFTLVYADTYVDKQCAIVLPRVLYLLLNIVSRTTYLELLVEFPLALKQLVRLCAASPMISDQLARYPLLLDELIDLNNLYQTLSLDNYKNELYQYLLRIESSDEEQQVEALRQFKQMQLLHIAAADVERVLPTMKVSDHLTYLAEAMLDFVVQLAWNQMTARYGRPDYLVDEAEKGLIVVGYGKLGGLELGYSSDLDLVFLHNCPSKSITTGDKVIDSRQFYLRLVQRIIHLFNIRTSSGIVYDVDLRLRPQGDAGLLACSLASFADYQHNEAWTWEHQALVRTRVVYGEKALSDQFDIIRHQVLSKSRDSLALKRDVREMRVKMRNHLSSTHGQLFDLKVDAGGIGDIEFISQYLVLNFAAKQPRMTIWSDNVRILELAAQYNIISSDESELLTQAYIMMRDETHRLSLQLYPALVNQDCFITQRQQVIACWDKWLTD